MHYFNSHMYTDCKAMSSAMVEPDVVNFNSHMYTDCKPYPGNERRPSP